MMSAFKTDSMRVIAQAEAVEFEDEQAAQDVAATVEQRVRELVQDGLKFMRHGKRTCLKPEDIGHSLTLRGLPPLYGFHTAEAGAFRQVPKKNDLFFVEDAVLSINREKDAQLPALPVDPYFSIHWLMVDGVQPSVPQNPVLKRPDAAEKGSVDKEEAVVKALAAHKLSTEQQAYFEHVCAAVHTAAHSPDQLVPAERSIASDAGLQQLVPYLVRFVADEVTANLARLPMLHALSSLVQALLKNPHIHLDAYLHQLCPAILTCVVGKQLGQSPQEDHWALRERAAGLVRTVCERFGRSYPNLQPRISKTLLRVVLDPTRPLTTHYGAIVALRAMGPHSVKLLLLPHLKMYLELLKTATAADNAVKKMEAWLCRAALQKAVTEYVLWEEVRTLHGVDTSFFTAEEKQSIPEEPRVKRRRVTSTVVKSEGDVGWDDVLDVFGEALFPYVHSHLARHLDQSVALALL